jgi:hypothetical protein
LKEIFHVGPPNIRRAAAFDGVMRATTIRFPTDLWEQLERAAREEGISVAQYVRDAALYRVAYSAGAREAGSGNGPFQRRGVRLGPDAGSDTAGDILD